MARTFDPDERSAWGKLQRARPGVDWHKASMRNANLVGDASVTRVMLGNDDAGTLYIGIVRAAREGATNPAVFEIDEEIGLAFEKIETREDWMRGGVFPLDGCRPKRGMQLLRVVAVASRRESLYYWNAESRRIDVWTAPEGPPREPEAWEDESTTG